MSGGVPEIRPIDSGTPPRSYDAGRRCDDCTARVSRYNPDTICAACTDRRRKAAAAHIQRMRRAIALCDEFPIHPIDRGSP